MELNSTLITREELNARLLAEGIDPKEVSVAKPRWAETAPKGEGVESALLTTDVIFRSDGSIVLLDGIIGLDSAHMADFHLGQVPNEMRDFILKVFPELGETTESTQALPNLAKELLGWDAYVKRLSDIPNGGVLQVS